MKNINFLTLVFLLFSSCCTHNLSKEIKYFESIHQKVYQEDLESLFRVFLFYYGRFPITINEFIDSAYSRQSASEWSSIKMRDPFSHNNQSFKYISFNDGKAFLLVSRGPDHRFNQYDNKSSLSSIINSPLLLADSECTDTTNYCDKDIIVLCSEAKSVLIANSIIMDSPTEYFDEMIAQNKRYTYSIKQVLLYIEPKTFPNRNIKIDTTNSFIDIIYKGYTFRYFISEYMNTESIFNEFSEHSFAISGVFSGYDEFQKIFIYKHCFYEQRKPIDAKKEYLKKREGAAFNINRCSFSLKNSIEQ